jgi:hypothetical protein
MVRRRVYGTGRLKTDGKYASFHFLNLTTSHDSSQSTVRDYLDDMMRYGFELEIYIQDGVHPEVIYAYGNCRLSVWKSEHWLRDVLSNDQDNQRQADYARNNGHRVDRSGKPLPTDARRMVTYQINWVGEPTESKPGIIQSLADAGTPVRVTVQEALDVDAYFGEAQEQAEILGEPTKCKTAGDGK